MALSPGTTLGAFEISVLLGAVGRCEGERATVLVAPGSRPGQRAEAGRDKAEG